MNMNFFIINIFEKIFILFPDPWPKYKHFKRRLIDKNFLMILYEGTKHCENCIASYSDYKFININKFI